MLANDVTAFPKLEGRIPAKNAVGDQPNPQNHRRQIVPYGKVGEPFLV